MVEDIQNKLTIVPGDKQEGNRQDREYEVREIPWWAAKRLLDALWPDDPTNAVSRTKTRRRRPISLDAYRHKKKK